jgi:uncharacterized protein (TIGR02266 family)
LTTDRARPDTDDPVPGKPEDVVRVRLRYPDLDTFVEKYAPNVTRGGIFLASREPRPVGEVLRFEVLLRQGGPVLSGEGRVTWVKEFNPAEPHRPYGMGVQFLYVDPDARQVLERLLKKKELSRSGPQPTVASPAPAPELRAAATVPDLRAISDDDLDENTMRRTLDRARLLSSRTDDLDALLAPDPEESPATLSQALAELPRLLSGKKPT